MSAQTPEKSKAPQAKMGPDFRPSGRLVAEANTVNGVVLKYVSPSDKDRPGLKWRLHVFKEKDQIGKPSTPHTHACTRILDVLHISKKDHYLIGRERKVADIPTDHPSCSGQHAVIQFREINTLLPETGFAKQTKPYIIDLESANGTLINGHTIESSRFVELLPGDVLRFGFSTRDYVLMHDEMV